ncbi:hydroxyethylthiazole kinase [Sporosarcina sp. ANT_H38]|uniref:hydroxyethylthiazole kinase n=1 Tax=Sporosarcina sp. ANT_H38 TaxID=2597358 RepID=UPI0011F3DBA4|nr:hydroxyethylthiazole kinase [Sporosarcina sp. ANT_H38]KAA0948722.1 hydroxyethylthiazole kinase [Sporosarcina sp. ANT_H38]
MNKEKVIALYSTIRKINPLIHHITNVVTINDCANVTLAAGASPVMATSVNEVEEMVQLADVLIINIGTIQAEGFKAMVLAGKAANKKGVPVIFDPVGVGATAFRKGKAKELLQQVDVAVIRGNASEVDSLIGGASKTRGVDEGDITITRKELAVKAANLFSCVVVVSGKVDTVSNGKETIQIDNGDSWLKIITGTGCMTTSLIGCFAGTTDNYFLASVAGMSLMSLAGERAKGNLQEGEGIGMYKVRLMDEIFNMNGDIWKEGVRLLES